MTARDHRWMVDAACREHPEVNFHPDGFDGFLKAKAICAGCLVRPECLSYAIEHGEGYGVWGGTNERERRRLRRRVA